VDARKLVPLVVGHVITPSDGLQHRGIALDTMPEEIVFADVLVEIAVPNGGLTILPTSRDLGLGVVRADQHDFAAHPDPRPSQPHRPIDQMTPPGDRVVPQLAALADQAKHRPHLGKPQSRRFTHRASYLRGQESPRSGSDVL